MSQFYVEGRLRAGNIACSASKLAIAAVGMVALAASALAQEAGPKGDASAPGDIVVTATRSAASITKIPVSVTALTSEALDKQGVRSMDDIARLVPGVSFTRGLGPVSSISIRGVSSNSGAATTGVYIDDTPIQTRRIGQGGTVYNAYPAIFDLDRVEVLRGPQGTLFGAGSQGGTIRFITPQPNLRGTDIYARSELSFTQGGDPSYEAGVAVGTPLVTDVLGLRVSAYRRHDGGYIDRVNPLTGAMADRNADWQDTTALRAALTFVPAENVKITPSIYYQKVFINTKSAIWGSLSDPSNDVYRSGAQVEEPTRDRLILPALDISVGLGAVTLFSNTSYLDRKTDVLQNFSNFIPAVIGQVMRPGQFVPGYQDYTSQGFDRNTQKSFTQEVRLQYGDSASKLKVVAGGFYQRSTQNAIEAIPETQTNYDRLSQAIFGTTGTAKFGALATSTNYAFSGGTTFNFLNDVHAVDTQLAGFADVTYRLTNRLTASAGLRYADIKFDFHSFSAGPYAGNSVYSGNQSEKAWTPKFNLAFQADPGNLYYANVAKGFRGGGANAPISSLCNAQLADLGYSGAPPTFNSDTVWSYEVGAKNSFFGRKVRVSSSAYLIEWSNIQQSIYLPSCGNSFVGNVGKARSKGFDIAFDVHPAKGLTLNAAVAYTDAKYKQTVLGGRNAAGNQVVIINKDNALNATPWLVSAGATYEGQVMGRDAYGRIDYTYKSADPNTTPVFDPATTSYSARSFQNPSTQVVNARIGTKFNGLDLSIFVNNLFNSHANLARVNLSPTRNLIDEFVILRPRTVGISLAYRQ